MFGIIKRNLEFNPFLLPFIFAQLAVKEVPAVRSLRKIIAMDNHTSSLDAKVWSFSLSLASKTIQLCCLFSLSGLIQDGAVHGLCWRVHW